MGMKHGFGEIYKRQTGVSVSRRFTRRYSAHEGILNQLDLYRQLNGDKCGPNVRTIDFNSNGDLLLSGSTDGQIVLWNWEAKTKKLSYESGHLQTTCHAKILPLTGDKRIVTSSTREVRLGEVLEDGQVVTKCLASIKAIAINLAVEPLNPHLLYSCSDAGSVLQYDVRSNYVKQILKCFSLAEIEYVDHLYGMVVNPMNPNYLCVGGSENFARVYDMRRLSQDVSISKLDKAVSVFCPDHLVKNVKTHIVGLEYSKSSELLVSYHKEQIYMFQKNMGLAPSSSFTHLHENMLKLDKPQVFVGRSVLHDRKGVSFFGPNDDYVMSGSDCGRIFIWKKKGAKLLRVMKGDVRSVSPLKPHPHIPIVASGGTENNVKLWAPTGNDAPPIPHNIQEVVESNIQQMKNPSPWS